MVTKAEARRDRGAAAVEFALVLPVLLLLVLGIVELGRAYHVQAMLAGAAREAVREVAISGDRPAAEDRVAQYTAGSVDPSALLVSIEPCTTTGAVAGESATVTLTYPMELLTGMFGAELELTGEGTMRCNG